MKRQDCILKKKAKQGVKQVQIGFISGGDAHDFWLEHSIWWLKLHLQSKLIPCSLYECHILIIHKYDIQNIIWSAWTALSDIKAKKSV